jgi:hypothetical protein
MTIARDFDFDDNPRKPMFGLDTLLMLARNRKLTRDHHRMCRAVEYFQAKFGANVAASVEQLAAIMGEPMERIQQLAHEIAEMYMSRPPAAKINDAS